MQSDMHYYATFFLAQKANIPIEDVIKIAYSAQYVDDSTKNDSNQHKDGGLLYGMASAHHPINCVKNRIIDCQEQRRVWVPFHFLPGGEGDTFEEKLLCVKNSRIVNQMFDYYISENSIDEFQLYLIGIACHVFMDTFSHYGFSGISSEYNEIADDQFKLHVKNEEMKQYIIGKMGKFISDFGLEKFASFLAQSSTHALGHGGVMTLPDRPYLLWEFKYKKPCRNSSRSEIRDNKKTFLEGCENLYRLLSKFSRKVYNVKSPNFNEIVKVIEEIIQFEGKKYQRIEKWKNVIDCTEADYNPKKWEEEKGKFVSFPLSEDAINTNVYRFHQAVSFHRYFILKNLLPKNEIAVY